MVKCEKILDKTLHESNNRDILAFKKTVFLQKDNEKLTVPMFADLTSRCCSGLVKFDAIRSCWTSLGKCALLSTLGSFIPGQWFAPLFQSRGMPCCNREPKCTLGFS